jgi:hypothetical protein
MTVFENTDTRICSVNTSVSTSELGPGGLVEQKVAGAIAFQPGASL